MNQTIKDLIEAYKEAKEAENKAIECRVAIGDAIALNLDDKTDYEGSRTYEVDNYKVTVKRTINRKVNWDSMKIITIDKEHAPIKTKQELDVPGLKWIKENEPEYYKELCDAITATPGRVAIEIKEKE